MSTTTNPGTPSWLRERNERLALSLLLEHGALTRNRIGQLSGLSKPTAFQIIARLQDAGLVEAVGEISGGRGPNALSYAVRLTRVLGVAVDVDESVVRSVVVDASGTEYPVVESEALPADEHRSAVSDIRSAIDQASIAARVDPAAVRVVAIGLPGSVDPRTDELNFVANLPGWPHKAVRNHLESALGLDVQMDNDVNLAAIAERCEGAGSGTTSFALLWMGQGLGLAVDLGGIVHHGAAGGAGEIGYLPVPWNAADIDPAARQLDDLIGGHSVIAIAREHGVSGVNDQDVIRALDEHPAREAVFTKVAHRVSLGIIPVLAVLDPELVVLAGPISTAGGELLAELVQVEIERTSFWHPHVTCSDVPQYPVLRGAREVLTQHVQQRLLGELGTPDSSKQNPIDRDNAVPVP